MRTSHRTIRKLIREEQSKITDEQLFSSQQFSAYMTDIVETATKRYPADPYQCREFPYQKFSHQESSGRQHHRTGRT